MFVIEVLPTVIDGKETVLLNVAAPVIDTVLLNVAPPVNVELEVTVRLPVVTPDVTDRLLDVVFAVIVRLLANVPFNLVNERAEAIVASVL